MARGSRDDTSPQEPCYLLRNMTSKSRECCPGGPPCWKVQQSLSASTWDLRRGGRGSHLEPRTLFLSAEILQSQPLSRDRMRPETGSAVLGAEGPSISKGEGVLELYLPASAFSSVVHVSCRLEAPGPGSGPCCCHGVVFHLPRR